MGHHMRCFCVTKHNAPLVAVDAEIPTLTGTQVLIKVHRAGVCHTDLHLWEGGYDIGGGKQLKIADRGINLPMTLGHEIAGEIVALGPDAEGVVGTRCVVHPWLGCGECVACLRGQENICIKPRSLGVYTPGGFAEYVVVPHSRYCVDIGDLDPSQAALLACSGVTTYSAIRKFGDLLKDQPLVIIGAGGLGFMALSILRALKCKGAIVVDLDAKKREEAAKAGALATIDGGAEDAAQQIIAATNGGALAVLDLVGAAASANLAIASVARGAHIVICGLYGGELCVPLPYIPMRPLHIQGSWVGTLPELRELVALAREAGLHAVPVIERPLESAFDTLMDLKQGRLVGRAVLVP